MESSKEFEAYISATLQEVAPHSSPTGRSRRGAGRQVVPLTDSLESKSLNYRLEREALLGTSESLSAMDFRQNYAHPLKMATTASISLLPTVPSMAADAVAVNCFKGLRRSRKGTRSPKGMRISEEEEREDERPASLRQRRARKVQYKVESDEDFNYIEAEEGQPREKASRRGKAMTEALQVDMCRQGVGGSYDQEKSESKNPCNTPNVSPPTRPAQLAREVTNAFVDEPGRMGRSLQGVRMERKNSVEVASVVEVSEQGLEGSRRPRMASDREQPNMAEPVEEVLRGSRNPRRARKEQAVQVSGDEFTHSVAARLPLKSSGRKVEQPESDAGNVVVGCLPTRASSPSKANQGHHKRKTLSYRETVSYEIAEPPARIPKLESQSPMSWQCFSGQFYLLAFKQVFTRRDW